MQRGASGLVGSSLKIRLFDMSWFVSITHAQRQYVLLLSNTPLIPHFSAHREIGLAPQVVTIELTAHKPGSRRKRGVVGFRACGSGFFKGTGPFGASEGIYRVSCRGATEGSGGVLDLNTQPQNPRRH